MLFFSPSYAIDTGAVLRMALDLLQVESETPTSWLVPISGFAAMCIGRYVRAF